MAIGRLHGRWQRHGLWDKTLLRPSQGVAGTARLNPGHWYKRG